MSDDEKTDPLKGLTTKVALGRLYDDIQKVLDSHEQKVKERRLPPWILNALDNNNPLSLFCWSSSIILFFEGLAFLLAYFFGDNDSSHWTLPCQSILIFILLGINLILVIRENRLRYCEMFERARNLLHTIKDAENTAVWQPGHYPNLHTPASECITLQKTRRDGKLINLPWALLTRGDIIILCPGQQAPGSCIPSDEPEDVSPLKAREVYTGGTTLALPGMNPRICRPRPARQFQLETTPYLTNLEMALEQALNRPVSQHFKARHLLFARCIERITVPAVAICMIIINLLRMIYARSWLGIGHWAQMVFELPAATVLPLLPAIFPTVWLTLHVLGNARIQTMVSNTSKQQATWTAIPTTPPSRKSIPKFKEDATTNSGAEDPFDEPISYKKYRSLAPEIPWLRVFKTLLSNETTKMPTRSVNILHALASVTALCCVDKKGILSWPNPTAEKVFFLKTPDKDSPRGSRQSDHEIDLNDPEDPADSSGAVAEVLDLTHEHTCPFRLQFDDSAWKRHLASLKPLGLSVLLNTCNRQTHAPYSRFCSHVAAESISIEELVAPVANRRCLCELAAQIGFQSHAADIFSIEHQLCTYRYLQPETARRDLRLARSLSLPKLRVPMPHMLAVIVKERISMNRLTRPVQQQLQLLSQGTADLILDSCVEYWDGKDLKPLSAQERKKAQDFYQRSSLTAYCTAFAYRPITRELSSSLSDFYLQLPVDVRPLPKSPEGSVDSLLHAAGSSTAAPTSASVHTSYSPLNDNSAINDALGCFQIQSNQVLIGMVTMQYQPQVDMIQLIEQLDAACVRFVHFSKENELRSRVFNEKMGLESGWNCHISLLSERNSVQLNTSRIQSMSAPGNLNLDPSQVRFESPESNGQLENEWIDGASSQDSVLAPDSPTAMDYSCTSVGDGGVPNSGTAGWRSLSCLTDSTEHSTAPPINFDMSNRAKLPRGIDKIRPHLEHIDNVPLLVSLFTDCTPPVTREMLQIMQDYNEVVVVMGSSANRDNLGVFLQGDASIGIEPLYPQVCQKIHAFDIAHGRETGPIELSRKLNTLACAFSCRREEPVSIYHLIMESRHWMIGIWSCTQFWVGLASACALVQLLASALLLPPVFHTGQVIWLSLIVVPTLSASLVGLPTDPEVMQQPTSRYDCNINSQLASFILWCYGLKFLPTVICVILVYTASLASLCGPLLEPPLSCSMIYPSDPDNLNEPTWGGWNLHKQEFSTAQHMALLVMVLHIVSISATFVQRHHLSWQRSPLKNKVWLIIVLSILCIQVLWTTITTDLLTLPWPVLILSFASPFAIFMTCELVKREEIKSSVRYQKRARLLFGTKLGMNSPF